MVDRRAKYSDFKTSFAVHPLTQDLTLNTNEQAVARSIKNLIFTNPGERVFQNDIGSGILDSLFENIDEDFDIIAEDAVRDVISRYEPRAEIVNRPEIGAYGIVAEALPDQNAIRLEIYFRTINSPRPVRLQALVKRIR